MRARHFTDGITAGGRPLGRTLIGVQRTKLARRAVATPVVAATIVALWVVLLHSHFHLVPDFSHGSSLTEGVQVKSHNDIAKHSCMSSLLSSGVVMMGNVSASTLARHRLYDSMKASSNRLMTGTTGTSKSSSTTIQGRGLNEFFYAEGNTTTRIRPILHHLDIPVRAVVLPITDTKPVESIAQALNDFLPEHQYTDTIWYQNLSLLHSTLYHASTHLDPVPASAEQVEAEYAAIVNAANALCPVIAVLDSVVYTESGTFLALWHIAQGGTISSEEPATIRNKLRQALPHASKKQVVLDDVILHTTLARVAISDVHPSITTILATAAAEITFKLCGLKAQLEVMWYVEEYDVLALALNGRLQVRNVPLRGCATP